MDYSIKNYNGAPNNTIVLPDHAPTLRSCIKFRLAIDPDRQLI